jgi:hypothetical protein
VVTSAPTTAQVEASSGGRSARRIRRQRCPGGSRSTPSGISAKNSSDTAANRPAMTRPLSTGTGKLGTRRTSPRGSGTPSNGTHDFALRLTREESLSEEPAGKTTAVRSYWPAARVFFALLTQCCCCCCRCDVGHKLVTLSPRVPQTRDSRGFLQGPGESPCRTRHLILRAGSLVSRGFP